MDFKKFFEQYLNFVKRYIPEPKVQSSVGIDIGLTSCKMMEVKQKGGSFELVRWAVESITGDDPCDAIRTLLDMTQNPDKPPAISVHGKGTLIRYVELPRMGLDDLKKSFVYEADKYLPFTADQVYLDCMILDPKGKGGKMKVMVAAAKKEIIDERIELLKKADIRPDFITLNPIATANVINSLGANHGQVLGGQDKDEAVAIVDIGEKVTNVNIVYDGLPHFTRDIFIAGMDFSRHLSNSLGISIKEAEALKCDPKDRKEEVMKSCESVVLNLISDMRLSFDYFVTEHNIPITKILLAGGASLLEGMPDMFKNYLEIDVQRLDLLEYIEVPEEFKEDMEKLSSQFGVALGLALY